MGNAKGQKSSNARKSAARRLDSIAVALSDLESDVDGVDADEADGVVVTLEVFEAWQQVKEFSKMLESLEIATSNPEELFGVLDADMSGELTVNELVDGLMRLRGPTQKSDSVASLLYMRCLQQTVHSFRDESIKRFDLVAKQQAAIKQQMHHLIRQ